MGFSVTIASSIVLIGLLAIFGSFSIAMFQGLRELPYIANEYTSGERERLDVELQLEIEALNSTSGNVTLRNVGCKTIFLKKQNGFSWNTLLLSYGNSSQWQSYAIEEYQILTIGISRTNITFEVNSHSFLNPGEEALIAFNVPDSAPEIPWEGIVAVSFVSHYGVTAYAEAVRAE